MEYSGRVGNCEVTGWRVTEEDDACLKLESHRPQSTYFHNFIKGSCKWSRLCPGIETTLFCPIEPEWKDGLIIDVRGHVYGIAIFWPYEDFSVLSSALRSNTIIDWQSQPIMSFGISKTLYKPLEETVRSFGVDIKLTSEMQTYFMDAEKAQNLTIDKQENIIIKKLDVKHASMVDSNWTGAMQNSLLMIEDMIRINHSVGIFTVNDSEPISWILESFYGLGFLHTVVEHRIKGYGAICVKALAKALGEDGKIVTAKGHIYGVAVFWPYEDFTVLSAALRSNTIFDWPSRPKMSFGIPKTLYEPLEETIRSLGVDIVLSYGMQTYFMDAEKARNLTIEKPEDVIIKKLDVSNASTVNSNWLGARQNSIQLIKDMIGINHSVGIFTANDSEPISWILDSFYALGFLHTVAEHRLKGYGAICVKALAKILGEEGNIVTAMVNDDNFSANKLFKKVGFQHSGILKVIQTCNNTQRKF